ncbi:acetyl-CoA acetyltransferase [Elizabethkingia meningoseptica]|uniref:Acetyl-CoA acetyltransferase n=1 Tax=Elizabethkingia meningoseptica TaxID=238 RepID=A0A1V3U5H7_ELIME|nr:MULTISPECIES: acetyl-CoA C-acetyltransferase [Elizabethkingia]AQX06816.1 acetyl-CoA acetyltransferase [Elizabethkingia meningoseptica]AQX11070.1 acetyl-CoA acetyltransferase [Elizabethkingia meningoseptica]AQX48863.1 acetyl-CoA acetyltransferase [Elizabethkingia meningoseptica]EOR28950.1 acetyl-CoA acetyltransferase [Elizabethkingia meningoseptica ATCC 13253 = NBRC 12535]KUY14949.1 acetyl-CoA acetyltransferase [Elizabethkingia meningoseptica]
METKKVAIVGYNRTPFVRYNTVFADASNSDLLLSALQGIVEKYKLQGKRLGEVAGGAVIKHISESNLIRETVMKTALDPATPGCDLQQACDTGIEAAIYIANKIALGQIEAGIACGVEAMSNIPFESSPALRKALLKAHKEKSGWGKLKQLLSPRIKDWLPLPYKGQEPETGLIMGEHTELTAQYYKISREEQDSFSLKSHQKLAKAYDEGFYEDMITPFLGVTTDNNLRRDSSLEKLASLKPAFDKNNGTLTAGNSTPFTDGASAILLASEEWAIANGLPILAYITYAEVAGIEYVKNRQDLLLAPVFAADRMLKKADMKLEEFDYYEIHEAFAAQILATLKIWEHEDLAVQFGLQHALGKIDPERLNIKGGSLATAHPFAATGGRIIATMAKLLEEKGNGKGFISICAARGQGVTMIIEK